MYLSPLTSYQRSPSNYDTEVQIIPVFSTGEDISPAVLAHIINTDTTHEKIPKQIVLDVPGHFMRWKETVTEDILTETKKPVP